MPLLSGTCNCFGDQGPSSWYPNAQITPREKEEEEEEGSIISNCLSLIFLQVLLAVSGRSCAEPLTPDKQAIQGFQSR